jgi:hypothetical protein
MDHMRTEYGSWLTTVVRSYQGAVRTYHHIYSSIGPYSWTVYGYLHPFAAVGLMGLSLFIGLRGNDFARCTRDARETVTYKQQNWITNRFIFR